MAGLVVPAIHVFDPESRPSRLLFSSVDLVTCDLPGPRIKHQMNSRAGPVTPECKACVVAAIDEEFVGRHWDNCDGCTSLKIEDWQGSTGFDLELATLDVDLKIGPHRRLRPDRGTNDRQLDRLVLPVAHDPEAYLGVDRPPRPVERLVERHAFGRCIVQMRDDVIGHDASPCGGRVADQRQHLEQTIPHCELDAEAAELGWLLLVA